MRLVAADVDIGVVSGAAIGAEGRAGAIGAVDAKGKRVVAGIAIGGDIDVDDALGQEELVVAIATPDLCIRFDAEDVVAILAIGGAVRTVDTDVVIADTAIDQRRVGM